MLPPAHTDYKLFNNNCSVYSYKIITLGGKSPEMQKSKNVAFVALRHHLPDSWFSLFLELLTLKICTQSLFVVRLMVYYKDYDYYISHSVFSVSGGPESG